MYRFVKDFGNKYLIEGSTAVKFNITGSCVGIEKINPIDYALYPQCNVISLVKSGSDFVSVGLQQGDNFSEKTYRTKKYFKMTSYLCESKPEDMLRNTGSFEGINFVQTLYIFDKLINVHDVWGIVENKLKSEGGC